MTTKITAYSYYRIESFWDHDQSWRQLMSWYAMNRSKADGAWMVLKSFAGGAPTRYRLVKYTGTNHQIPGEVIDEHCHPGLRLN